MTDHVSKGRKRWLKICALIICTVAVGVWFRMEFVSKCDLDMIERAAERVREALEQRHGRANVHALEGLEEACSPYFPGVINTDYIRFETPSTSYGLKASSSPVALWRRKGAVAHACGIWRWEVEGLYGLATGETLGTIGRPEFTRGVSWPASGSRKDVARRGSMSWIWLVAADFMHEEGLLESPEGRLLLRALVSGSPPVQMAKGMMLYEAEQTRADAVASAPQIAATRRAVIFGEHRVVDIRSGVIDKSNKATIKGQNIVQPIFDHATEEFLRQDRASPDHTLKKSKPYGGSLNILVDQTLPTEIAVDIGNSVQRAWMKDLFWTVRSPTPSNDVLTFHFKCLDLLYGDRRAGAASVVSSDRARVAHQERRWGRGGHNTL